MGIDILSELGESMLDEINGLASYHGVWAQRSKDAVLIREAAEIERHDIDDLTCEDTWDAAVYSYEVHLH